MIKLKILKKVHLYLLSLRHTKIEALILLLNFLPLAIISKKRQKLKKGNSTPGRTLVGKVTAADVEKIAKEKMADLNAIDLNGAINMVKGSAVSMGMEVVG